MKRYCIITIEREYASGGSLVGKLVGQALGIPVYGREILEIAAREGGTTPEYIEHLEETDTNSLLYSLVAMAKTVQGQLPQISKTDQLNLLEARIIQRLAQEGPCVIVGRCAGWVLREQPHVLNVFIHADRQERLRRAVEEALLSFYGALEGRDIEPQVRLPEEKVERLLDPAALSRVLGNILTNALKYSAGDLEVTLEERGRLTFSNAAPGLDPVTAGRLFDRFYTVEAARNSTGLGLSIAKELTQRMGGSIGAALHSGTLTVWVEFPRQELDRK